ncbi:MAG: hypothetical protein HC848_04840 [Limnobacter sp.]|nr:hypothetical protein [Limnobacter sp.]
MQPNTMHTQATPAKAAQPFTRTLFTWLCVGFMLASLSACGFKLRGQNNFNFQALDRTGLENTEMARTMDLFLKVNGLAINEGNSQVRLTLLSQSQNREIVTFSATGRAREVRINYNLTFSVKNAQGEFLIADTLLTQSRELNYDDTEILGKEAEEDGLYKEMQQDIAQLILNRLSRLPANLQASKPAAGTTPGNTPGTSPKP